MEDCPLDALNQRCQSSLGSLPSWGLLCGQETWSGPRETQGLAGALLVYTLKRKKPPTTFIWFSSEIKTPCHCPRGIIWFYEQIAKGILPCKKKERKKNTVKNLLVVGFLQFLQLSYEMLDVCRRFCFVADLLGSRMPRNFTNRKKSWC